MKSFSTSFVVLLCFASLLALSACGGASSSRSPKVAEDQPKVTHWALLGDSAGSIDLADYATRPVLVYYLSADCPDCLAALPALLLACREKQIGFLPISLDREPNPEVFFAASGEQFLIAKADETELSGQTFQGPLVALPTAFLLDCDGNLLSTYRGNLTVQHLSLTARCDPEAKK